MPIMDKPAEVLRDAMRRTGTTQSELARLSGVHQPSISQYLSGRVGLSDEQAGRLLSCLGFRLDVVLRAVEPPLARSERRSWLLHRELARMLDAEVLRTWSPKIEGNLARLSEGLSGQPHVRNLARWSALVRDGDVLGLKRVLTSLDRDGIEMREVSPFSGLLAQDDRLRILAGAA